MNPSEALQRVGTYVVQFQQLEGQINEIIVLLAGGNEEVIRILVNELEFSKRLKTADVLYSYFLSLRSGDTQSLRNEFHKLIGMLGQVGERRNELVHSSYHYWITHEKKLGLIRCNARLRSSKGVLERVEEELLPESFAQDLEKLNDLTIRLEHVRRDLIDLIYPEQAS